MFDADFTGLAPVTKYYYRAYAINSVGTAYGTEYYFTTLAGTPTVTTATPATSITSSGATLGGEVVDDNGGTITERGFVYALTSNPTTSNSKATVTGTEGVMSKAITGLTSATLYHFRAFATNSYGTSYGDDVSFTTLPTDPSGLSAVTSGKTTIDLTWVKGSGNYTIVRRGTTPPANINSGTLIYQGTGTSYNDTGLTQGTQYYYRAWSATTADWSVAYSSSYSADDATTVADFIDPDHILTDDSDYATASTTSGVLSCQVSKDGGANWSTVKTLTFTGTPSTSSFGNGETELWGYSWTGDSMDDTNFMVKLSGAGGLSYQIFGGFGFSLSPTYILTGVNVQVKAAYSSPNLLIYFVKVDPQYGTSNLPIGEGSLAYDTTEKVPTYYDGTAWIPLNTGGGATWQGDWVTSTVYAVGDIVGNNGSAYICTDAHTSGATTEPGVGASWTSYWDIYVQGNAGLSLQNDSSETAGSTKGTLSGTIDGSNAVFTVSLGSYISGSLIVTKNGQTLSEGSSADYVETTPSSGTFTFNIAPATGSRLEAIYQYTTGSTGNADTLDGSHLADIIDTIYPIGSVYISVVSTNPGTLFGRGTWAAFGEGRTLIGIKSTDTDFDAAEKTGGDKTKTIAQANLPNISTGAGTAHTHTQNSHSHNVLQANSGAGGSWWTASMSNQTGSDISRVTGVTSGTTATNNNESSHTHSLGGSGTALNVMNPYIVTYMWKRTA